MHKRLAALLRVVLVAAISTQFAYAQTKIQLQCQALVFVDESDAETKKLIEDFEFLITPTTPDINFEIRGLTHIKLKIRDKTPIELIDKQITQQVDLSALVWKFEFSEGEGVFREHMQLHLHSVSGKLNYQRNSQGTRVRATGTCKRSFSDDPS